MSRNIIGISAFFHDAACCLIQDGVLTAAAEEERFTRIKADPSLPKHAFNYCLQAGGLSLPDIDLIAYYEDPVKKYARQLWSGVLSGVKRPDKGADPNLVEHSIREVLGYEGEIRYVDHHLSHAASSFYFSGFSESAILTVDGVGEWATTTYGRGSGKEIDLFEEVHFPDSLGLLYSTITSYLGFGVNDGEYKVMGLAPYGEPRYVDLLLKIIRDGENGQYKLEMEYFDFLRGRRMFTDELPRLFGQAPRQEDSQLLQFHADVARSMQFVLGDILLRKAHYLFDRTGMEDLCMAGGVALNCVANGEILRKGPFKRLFVQPASNDAGGALGAAMATYLKVTDNHRPPQRMQHVYWGPSYAGNEVRRLLEATPIVYHDCSGDAGKLSRLTAERLAQNKVIGWFQGRMEFGPRSLGARSILADPRNEKMRDRINAMVKKREAFRPFAPAVIDSMTYQHFDLDHPSPFMLETCQVVSHLYLPAVTHVDGSARVQTVSKAANPRFYDLLRAFEAITGCPILLNTSFNIKGEPIVCTPEDALRCFITTDIDCLVIEDFIIDRDDNNFDLQELIFNNEPRRTSGIVHDVYTFV